MVKLGTVEGANHLQEASSQPKPKVVSQAGDSKILGSRNGSSFPTTRIVATALCVLCIYIHRPDRHPPRCESWLATIQKLDCLDRSAGKSSPRSAGFDKQKVHRKRYYQRLGLFYQK